MKMLIVTVNTVVKNLNIRINMKLYYNTISNEIVEVGIFNNHIIGRNEIGNMVSHKNMNDLVLIGDIYDKPIDLSGVGFELFKMNILGEKKIHIITGTSREQKLEQGLRFFVDGRGFNFYSTNIVIGSNRISSETIDFYTLSGSHYRIEIL
jgi:hypothetical protein